MSKTCTKCKVGTEFYSGKSQGWCKACRKEYQHNHYTRNKERHRQRGVLWAAAHRDECRGYVNAYYRRLRDFVIDAYGAVCVCCGETTRQFLTLDHVNNDGTPDRLKHGGNRRLLAKIRATVRETGICPPQYQILCFNCNCSKGFYGRCPHTAR